MKVVYVLGAGFSKPAGLPLMDEFVSRMVDRGQSGQINEANFKIWHDFVKERLAEQADEINDDKYPLNFRNLESLLSFLALDESHRPILEALILSIAETINIKFDNLPGKKMSRAEYSLFFNWINENYGAIHNALDLWVQVGTQFTPPMTLNYAKLLFLTALGFPGQRTTSTTIVSFNYDLLIESECILKFFGKEVKKHVSYWVGDNNIIQGDPRFTFVKPNGSLNCVFCDRCGSLSVDDLATRPYFCLECKSLAHPLIIPPTTTRDKGSFGKLDEVLYRSFSEADYIVFIGFSFPKTDNRFGQLIGRALKPKLKFQKLVVLCPGIKPEETGYANFILHGNVKGTYQYGIRGEEHHHVEKCFDFDGSLYTDFLSVFGQGLTEVRQDLSWRREHLK